MTGNLKALGLALAAVFALNVMAASGASAAEFTSESSPAILDGSQEGVDIFTVDGGNTECQVINYSGTMSTSPTSEVELSPSFSGCEAFGLEAHINPNGCKYRFHNTGTVDIVCPGANQITETITDPFTPGTASCVIHIPSQNGISGITYTNVGTGTTREITIDVNISTGIKYSQTTGSGIFECETRDNTTNGKYIGHTIVTGTTSGGLHQGIDFH